MKQIFVAGGTGFIGRSLIQKLIYLDIPVTAWVRSTTSARNILGSDVHLLEADGSINRTSEALSRCSAVVNLAGENIFKGFWTQTRKKTLRTSRIETTAFLIKCCHNTTERPELFLSASAVGYYGARRSKPCFEDSAPGSGFLAELCMDWEAEARKAHHLGMRWLILRLGIVLGLDGGALPAMLPLFTRNLGATLGRRYRNMSWIHITDLIALIVKAIQHPEYQGVVNAVAPDPVTNLEFTQCLANTLKKRAFLHVPSLLIRVMMGKKSDIILSDTRVVPQYLLQMGFKFQYPRLKEALHATVRHMDSVQISRMRSSHDLELPDFPQFTLQQSTHFKADSDHVFTFFSNVRNLGFITPRRMRLNMVKQVPETMKEGCRIILHLRIGPLPLKWETLISIWEPSQRFVDMQIQGPYKLWRHEHRFIKAPDGLHMIDTVHYSLPAGCLGRLAHALIVKHRLIEIFAVRSEAISRILNGAPLNSLNVFTHE